MFDALTLDKILPEATKVALWMWGLARQMEAAAVATLPWPLRIAYYVAELAPVLVLVNKLSRRFARF